MFYLCILWIRVKYHYWTFFFLYLELSSLHNYQYFQICELFQLNEIFHLHHMEVYDLEGNNHNMVYFHFMNHYLSSFYNSGSSVNGWINKSVFAEIFICLFFDFFIYVNLYPLLLVYSNHIHIFLHYKNCSSTQFRRFLQ